MANCVSLRFLVMPGKPDNSKYRVLLPPLPEVGRTFDFFLSNLPSCLNGTRGILLTSIATKKHSQIDLNDSIKKRVLISKI